LRYFESMQEKILQLFLEDVPTSTGLTHWQIREEFERKFPAIRSSNVDRRVQELARAGKLWAHKDDDRTVRFYLRLMEKSRSDKSLSRVTTSILQKGL
jgi:phage terminase Nu1 subunit (DNA packaging protein)